MAIVAGVVRISESARVALKLPCDCGTYFPDRDQWDIRMSELFRYRRDVFDMISPALEGTDIYDKD